MFLKISHDNNSLELIQKLKEIIDVEAYNEDVYSSRKKAFSFKHTWGAKKTPFAMLYNEENTPIMAFYSEDNNCNYETIFKYVSKSN
jgi:hypothetical protein